MNPLTLPSLGWRALLMSALVAAGGLAHAQGDKPVRVIVPLTTGSTVDTLARALSPPLARALGQPVVVENIAGAGGVSGTAQLVRAPKDGQTLALVSSNHVINPAIYKSMPFDTLKDLHSKYGPPIGQKCPSVISCTRYNNPTYDKLSTIWKRWSARRTTRATCN